MENDATEQARAALKSVPAFAGLDPDRVAIDRLGGEGREVFSHTFAAESQPSLIVGRRRPGGEAGGPGGAA